MARRDSLKLVLAAAFAPLALSACANLPNPKAVLSRAPAGQMGVPASGVTPDLENAAVIAAMMQLGARPLHTLAPAQARDNPTAADGVERVLLDQGRPTAPLPGIATLDIGVDGADGPLRARVYTPAVASGPLPVIVYFHGGGWVIGDIAAYDAGARGIAREGQAVVVSVDYRLAPEHKFPAQHEDALAAYRWALANAASIGGDPARVGLAGESAGGNLAVATAIAARDAGLQRPFHLVSIYPIAGAYPNTPSYRENANAMPLNRAGMLWFFDQVKRTDADLQDPRINLVAADVRGLPPTTMVFAQIDPLRSEGETLARRLRAAGVDVEWRTFEGATHEFFGMDRVFEDAQEAQGFVGARLRGAPAGRRFRRFHLPFRRAPRQRDANRGG
ncbi:MAG: alpha/beta hydrolase [Pseudomonadota bacterium]|nr:alpha/beta hydrolase [Pseudomonadota bacterium]